MDAFFASVSLLRYPELRDQPVVVAGHGEAPVGGAFMRLRDYVGRGVLTTANYKARALGVHSAMGTMHAARLAPDAILLPVDFAAYRQYSRRFKAAAARVAPRIENRGIDEIYLDLTGLPGDAPTLGRRLKAAVLEATGLRCSVGIAANKLVAKLASELDKPDGLTVIGPGDFERRIWPLPVSRVNGIGPKATARLAQLGIETVAQLAAASPARLQARFGARYTRWLLDAAHGVDARPVVVHAEPKAISHETTFERDLHVRSDRAQLSAVLQALCADLADSLAGKGLVAHTLGVKVRFADFRIVTRVLTVSQAVADAETIRWAAGQCLKRIVFDRRLRLLGVRAAGLAPRSEAERTAQLDLDLDY